MKEHIYTIPVTDGFDLGGECPFCNMRAKLERDAVDFTLGPAATYMESDVRDETDAKGFCPKHFEILYREPNALGLALITHTHLRKVAKDLAKLGGEVKPGAKKSFFSRPPVPDNAQLLAHINKITGGCCVCERVDNTFARYVDTYFYLWSRNDGIRELTKECKGFCIGHYAVLIEEGAKKLGAAEYAEFLSTVQPLQQANLERLADELDWFIQKFDYRFADEPWKNSKDSLHRAINKLSAAGLTE